MSDNVLAKIDEQVKNNRVIIYMKGTPEFPQCGFSDATVRLFQVLGYPFATVDVLAEPEIREGIKRYSNWPTIPQVFVDGKLIGGCDIVKEMHNRGELEPLLKAAFSQ